MSQIIGGYICKGGKRVVFYDCDPAKNETCKKTSCVREYMEEAEK